MSVSIIIRTTGKRKKIPLLRALLQSLSRQTYKSYKLIIVTEENTGLINKLASRYFNNFKVIESRFRNRCRASNLAILLAKSEYVAILDDDCVLSENWLEELIQTIRKLPKNIACIASDRIPMYREKEAFKYKHPFINRVIEALSFRPLLLKKGKQYSKEVFIGISFGATNILCKRQALLNIGGFDIELEEPLFGDDLGLALKLYKRGYRNAIDFKVKAYHLERYVLKQIGKDARYFENTVYSEMYVLGKNIDVFKVYAFTHLLYRILWSFLYAIRGKNLSIVFLALRGGLAGLIRGMFNEASGRFLCNR